VTQLVERLVSCVSRGEFMDLAGGEHVEEPTMRSWGEERTVHASVIRDIMRGRLAPEPDPRGVRLRGVRIEGCLDLAHLTSEVPLELRDCLLTSGMTAQDARLSVLSLNGCLLQHPDLPPIDADRLAAAMVSLKNVTVLSASPRGALRLEGARIGGVLDCSGARLLSSVGAALHADNLSVGQDVFLRDGFEATGSGEQGAVRLFGAHIGGSLICTGAQLHNDTGPALHADNLQVDQPAFLDGGFTATSSSEDGAVRLFGAHIGGSLICTGAQLHNDTGPALHADNLRAEQDIFLWDGFEATGSGTWGAVRLSGARIGGTLNCRDATLRNDTGAALHARNLQVGEDVLLRKGFEAVGGGEDCTIELTGVRIVSALSFEPSRLEHGIPSRRLEVEGLQYTGLPEGDWRIWRQLLQEATPSYTAQPYQQLAAAHRAAGHDREARTVLIAQRRDQLRRAATTRGEKAWGHLTWLTLGYGYQTWRALLGLLAVALIAVAMTSLGPGAHGGLESAGHPRTAVVRCSSVDRIGIGLDLGLPLIKAGSHTSCRIADNPPGHTLLLVGWALQSLAWAFASLFVAGFTSAVRKT